MTEPGVSPTAIEIAAKALYPNGPGDGSDALWFDVVEDVTLVIRALVDSGELHTTADLRTQREMGRAAAGGVGIEKYENDHLIAERDRLAAEVTQLRGLLNMDPLQANRALREEIILLEARYEMDWKDNDAEIQRLAAEVTRLETERGEWRKYGEDCAQAMVTSPASRDRDEAQAEVERLSQANTRLVEALTRLHEVYDKPPWWLLKDGEEASDEEVGIWEGTLFVAFEHTRAVLGEFIREGERP